MIHLDELSNHVRDTGCVDFYATYRTMEDMDEAELLKKRMKTEFQPIELSWQKDEQKGIFFLPYTTKKGNFSLKILAKKPLRKLIMSN